MRRAIINIQSTAIEFLACEIDTEFQVLLYDKEKFSIINYVSNNKLLKLGYDKLKKCLEYYQRLSKNLLCEELYVVASDSLRNFDSVSLINKIKKEMGISIKSINQMTETFLIVYGNKEKFKSAEGCLFDMNGYSSQLIDLTKNKENYYLFDFGQLKVKYLYDSEDYNKYYDDLKKFLMANFEAKLVNKEYKKMYITGAFAKGFQKIYENYYNIIHPVSFEYKKAKKLFKYLLDSPTKTDSLLNAIPKKLDYFMNGYIIFITLAKYLKIEQIEINDFGFNEGFLLAVNDNIEEIEDLRK